MDQANQKRLSEHCSIHLLELDKWQYTGTLNPEDQWLYFFKEAEYWEELPAILNTPAMRQAMRVLKRFTEKEANYHLYQARQNAIREEQTRQKLLKDALRDKEAALQREEAAQQDKEEAQRDKEATAAREKLLREILQKAGIEPDV